MRRRCPEPSQEQVKALRARTEFFADATQKGR